MGFVEGRETGEVVGRVKGVQGRVDRRWEKGMGKSTTACHEVESL